MGSNQINSDRVFFFHGFWGQASDWHFLKTLGLIRSYEAVDYLNEPLLSPQNYISDWGQNFLKWKMQKIGSQKIDVVGYSQGGRLLLHALTLAPEQFNKVILISVHPGLQKFEEKEQRLKHDRSWAKKFRTCKWEDLQNEWNQQAVFQGKNGPKKRESEFNREELALCFENWSLAHQQNFRELINSQSERVRIILGESDTKYIQLYKEFLTNSDILKMEKGAAHRVPFDQPSILVETLNSLLS